MLRPRQSSRSEARHPPAGFTGLDQFLSRKCILVARLHAPRLHQRLEHSEQAAGLLRGGRLEWVGVEGRGGAIDAADHDIDMR